MLQEEITVTLLFPLENFIIRLTYSKFITEEIFVKIYLFQLQMYALDTVLTLKYFTDVIYISTLYMHLYLLYNLVNVFLHEIYSFTKII